MKRIQYTVFFIAVSLAASCNQIDNVASDNGVIRFAPQSVNTKAMVTSDNLTEQAFRVIDLMGTDLHISDRIVYSDGAWVYDSGSSYFQCIFQIAPTNYSVILKVAESLTARP